MALQKFVLFSQFYECWHQDQAKQLLVIHFHNREKKRSVCSLELLPTLMASEMKAHLQHYAPSREISEYGDGGDFGGTALLEDAEDLDSFFM